VADTTAQVLAHWEDDPELWDTLQVGPWTMPGVWTVDFSIRREIDVKKAVSTDGARLKDKGYAPPQLTLTGKLTTRDDWNTLQGIMPSIHPRRPGAARTPFRIVHPKTLLMGITAIFIHEVDAVTLDNGVLGIQLRSYEWLAPKKVKKGSDKPKGDLENVDPYTDPPPGLARYPGMRGVRADGDPDNPTVLLPPGQL
jgi:hypothetical protein